VFLSVRIPTRRSTELPEGYLVTLLRTAPGNRDQRGWLFSVRPPPETGDNHTEAYMRLVFDIVNRAIPNATSARSVVFV